MKMLNVFVCIHFQFSHLENIYRFVVITVYVVMSGVEIVRLYLGYLGNLQERVSLTVLYSSNSVQ